MLERMNLVRLVSFTKMQENSAGVCARTASLQPCLGCKGLDVTGEVAHVMPDRPG